MFSTFCSRSNLKKISHLEWKFFCACHLDFRWMLSIFQKSMFFVSLSFSSFRLRQISRYAQKLLLEHSTTLFKWGSSRRYLMIVWLQKASKHLKMINGFWCLSKYRSEDLKSFSTNDSNKPNLISSGRRITMNHVQQQARFRAFAFSLANLCEKFER